MHSRSARLIIAAVLLVMSASARAQMPDTKAHQMADMKATLASAMVWNDLVVPGFAPGTKIAAILGDPAVADQPYTLRLKFPDGYRFPAHWHPKVENLTVLSGTFLLSMGGKEGGPYTQYAPGAYLFIPPTMPHSGGATGETVIQLHGIGPFEIKLVNPVK